MYSIAGTLYYATGALLPDRQYGNPPIVSVRYRTKLQAPSEMHQGNKIMVASNRALLHWPLDVRPGRCTSLIPCHEKTRQSRQQ
ncbi:hypothetical protein RCH09_000208 [Actimicrobium sp. GrIS 1.19]|uniref:hypothetical protein n=1 Tax=Actimicrobium sp. GrIS 1.19 TaxID=3071708 RepID=UPI002DF82E3F|nr:hypothetical protein [Actimicrobium sp. GrIS 1.19]